MSPFPIYVIPKDGEQSERKLGKLNRSKLYLYIYKYIRYMYIYIARKRLYEEKSAVLNFREMERNRVLFSGKASVLHIVDLV